MKIFNRPMKKIEMDSLRFLEVFKNAYDTFGSPWGEVRDYK